MCRWWPAARSGGGWSLDDKVGTESIVYMHVSASPLALAGATGAFPALEDLSIREEFGLLTNKDGLQQVLILYQTKKRSTVVLSSCLRGGKREINWKSQNRGGWSFTPCPGTIGASCMGAARNALGTAEQSSHSGLTRINKPTPRMEPCATVSAGHGFARRRYGRIHVDKYPPITYSHTVTRIGSTLPEVIIFEPRALP